MDQVARGLVSALTFDDVLLVPRHSTILPSAVDVSTRLTRNIRLNVPLVSAPWTPSPRPNLAIAMASTAASASFTRTTRSSSRPSRSNRVKRSESGMIVIRSRSRRATACTRRTT